MDFPIITIARWFGHLTDADVSDHFDEQHPFMAFAGSGWDALELSLPFGGVAMTSLKQDTSKSKRFRIGNYFSARAKEEIKENVPAVDVRNMR